jgi:hypothetical protein
MQETCGSTEQDQLYLLPVSAGLVFDREDGSDVVLWKVGLFPDYTASQLRVSTLRPSWRIIGSLACSHPELNNSVI